MIRDFIRFCLAPEKAYEKKNADLSFYGMILPCAAFMLFALNVAIERASFIRSAGGVKIVLLAFIGLIIGAAAVGMFTLSGIIGGKTSGKAVSAVHFLGITEFSFAFSVIIELFGLLIRLIFQANIASVFGILGIFTAFVPIFRSYSSVCGVNGMKNLVLCSVSGILLMLGMNIVFFVSL